MSCHHGDRIGNSFSDNIAVGPFVELFAYCDSRRPPELGVSLSIQRKVGLSHPLGSLPHRGPCSYMPGLYQVGRRFLDHHSASYRRNSWENKIKDKKRVKNLPSVPGKFESLYFSLDPLGWVSYTSHLHNPLQGRGAGGDVHEVWPSRMIQAHKNPELLLPLLGWICLNPLLFFFQWSFL